MLEVVAFKILPEHVPLVHLSDTRRWILEVLHRELLAVVIDVLLLLLLDPADVPPLVIEHIAVQCHLLTLPVLFHSLFDVDQGLPLVIEELLLVLDALHPVLVA